VLIAACGASGEVTFWSCMEDFSSLEFFYSFNARVQRPHADAW
jgi:hypothetical protein